MAEDPHEHASTPSPASWWQDAVCWQVYPLGFCDAPPRSADPEDPAAPDPTVVHRLPRLLTWLDHLIALGANVLLLNPVFASVSHGYDTLDHRRIDPRLGDRADLDRLLEACHARGIRLVLDGVFNHLSACHPIVRRAVAAGPGTEDGAWIRWADGYPYGFEGNDDLVELDLATPAVQDEIASIMCHWLEGGIDGWRLDAMYSADPHAWARILTRVRAAHPEAWILGEVIHGDHVGIVQASTADSLTQYELWKAIWSSLHDGNLFELAHAVGRHERFLEAGTLPLTFLGNHDTTRIASQLPDGRDLPVAVALLALLPGVPCIYAGDEFGAVGVKEDRPGGDDAVRPVFPDRPEDVPEDVLEGRGPTTTSSGGAGFPPLQLLSPSAAPRILEVHERVFALRRRIPWLVDARVDVPADALTNTTARFVLSRRAGDTKAADTKASGTETVVLCVNLDDAPVPAPSGTVIEQVCGADVLDAVGPAAPDVVPAHGVAVVSRTGSRFPDDAGQA
jgi:cyclomaltodextrinase